MQINVTGRHVEATPAVKNYAQEKLIGIINKHLPDRITKVHLIMNVQKYRHLVEAELHGPRVNIYATSTSGDMYTSVDKVLDKIGHQLVKYKTKLSKSKHNRSSSIRKLDSVM